jgi:hypothetical protein
VEAVRQVLPADLENMVPGPFMAAVVSSADPSPLNGYDVVRLMRARARLSSHHEAAKLEAIFEVAFAPPSDDDDQVLRSSVQVEYAALEVAAALVLTRRTSESQLDLAVSLAGKLRRVLEAFSRGDLDLARARVFDQQLGHLPEETVETVLDQILDGAGSLTTGQRRAHISKLVLEADPDGSKSSYEEGLRDRKVGVTSNPDHTANLQIFAGAPEDVIAARDYVEFLARSLKTKSEPRTLDQLRNDVALDLLRGQHPNLKTCSRSRGRTNITVSAETLAGLSDAPGELEGYGPVFAEIARKTVMSAAHQVPATSGSSFISDRCVPRMPPTFICVRSRPSSTIRSGWGHSQRQPRSGLQTSSHG